MEKSTSGPALPANWVESWAPMARPPETPIDTRVRLHDFNFTEAQIAEFWEHGFVKGPQVLDDEQVELLRREIARLYTGEVDNASSPYEYHYYRKCIEKYLANSPDVLKINNAWWINTAIRSVVTSPVLGKAAAQLLRTPEVRLWHDQAIRKPPLSANVPPQSGNIGWHQDYAFWQCSSSNLMATAWIPLQDVDTTNGAMRTIVSSHRWGLVADSARFFDKDLDALQEQFIALNKGPWIEEPAILKAGEVIFHHALTFHASGPNLSSQVRWALAVHMQSKDCAYRSGYGHHHNVADLGPDAKDGDLFAGTRFPRMYP